MSGVSGPQVPAEKLNFMKDKTECSTRLKTKRSIFCTLFQNKPVFVLFCESLYARIQMWVCVGMDRGLGDASHTGLYRCSKKKSSVML